MSKNRPEAAHHRMRAADRIREAAHEQDDDQARQLHHQADAHIAEAERLEQDHDLTKPEAPAEEVGQPAEHARADQDRARAWYLPGSVAQEDLGLQLSEAQQGDGLLAASLKYAARAVYERDGAAVNAVATTATEATKAAVSAVVDTGKATAQMTGQALSKGAEALGKAGRGAAASINAQTQQLGGANEKAQDLVKQHAPPAAERAAPAKGRER